MMKVCKSFRCRISVGLWFGVAFVGGVWCLGSSLRLLGLLDDGSLNNNLSTFINYSILVMSNGTNGCDVSDVCARSLSPPRSAPPHHIASPSLCFR